MNSTMNPYLRTKIMTAKPEELRLMLIEGAIKFSRQAAAAMRRNDLESVYSSLQRAKAICLELSSCMQRELNPELCDRLAALYTFIYKRLIDASLERDVTAIDDAINLLEYERETWVLAIRKLQEERAAGRDPVAAARDAQQPDQATLASIGTPRSSTAPAEPSNAPTPHRPRKRAPEYVPPAPPPRPTEGGFSIEG